MTTQNNTALGLNTTLQEQRTTVIFCTIVIEGTHNWPNCPFEEVDYLRVPHRHLFYVKVWAPVYHTDRDIEFIMFKHEIQQYIMDKYYDETKKCCAFGAMSCEMIANELLDHFTNLVKVEVNEDNENGAVVDRVRVRVNDSDLIGHAL